jgi:hypothetical protein
MIFLLGTLQKAFYLAAYTCSVPQRVCARVFCCVICNCFPADLPPVHHRSHYDLVSLSANSMARSSDIVRPSAQAFSKAV